LIVDFTGRAVLCVISSLLFVNLFQCCNRLHWKQEMTNRK